jgi:hypothetical protein
MTLVRLPRMRCCAHDHPHPRCRTRTLADTRMQALTFARTGTHTHTHTHTHMYTHTHTHAHTHTHTHVHTHPHTYTHTYTHTHIHARRTHTRTVVAGCGVQCGGFARKLEQRHKARLTSELVKLKVRARVRETVDLLPAASRTAAVVPRWARVNTLKGTVANVVTRVQAEGACKRHQLLCACLRARVCASSAHPQISNLVFFSEYGAMRLSTV